jgi:hypothetical protein
MAQGAIITCDGQVSVSGEAVGSWHGDGQGGFVVDLYSDAGVALINCGAVAR